ncbi:hypothetical protein PF005_g26888 [Phytophthora fragariae]|uniref:Uncharacterized protein n=1 Tax=Phytophthora fragariae TaxID=53985 RepID=A0A6A3HIB4_9STRA|nr:hypothetical protein PF011_g26841 [Phytophthora fragariae]KAE9172047.1 hypothetical protein PF005_g26888 [Phytophthora fragariae]KAE9176997.1 hypothetical protein PF002_g28455 [Phytophthora fragariae]
MTKDDVTTMDDVMRSPPRGQASHASGQWTSGPVGTVVLTMVTEDVKTMVVTVQSPRIIISHVGLVTDLHPQFVTNASMAIQHRGMMIVDTIYSIMPDRHRSTATPDRHSSTETNKVHPSGLVINVDHHPDGATRHHVDQETFSGARTGTLTTERSLPLT